MDQPQLIVVGAGSAGCALAARLAREFAIRVVLLEPPSTEAPTIDRQRPARWLNLLGSADDWGLLTRPNERLASRQLAWPRGRGLGGSGRINAMIWFPPTAADLEGLGAAAGGHWSVDELEANYQSLEAIVRPESPAWLSEPSRRFLDAAVDVSNSRTMVYRRLQRNGRRWLPAELLPTNERQVEVIRGTVDHLLWHGDKAIGVRAIGKQGRFDLVASRGVVLTAGAIATPSILMRSGVGDRDELKRHGIATRLDVPSVGKHLSDHLIMPVVFQRHASQTAFRMKPTMQALARWQVVGTGPIASNLAECGGLFDGQSIQIHTTPTHYLTYPKRDDVPCMTIGVNVTQPNSKGWIRLTSKHADAPPDIEPNYLGQPADMEGTMRGVRLARQLAQRSPLAESIQAEALPGSKRSSDEEITRAISRYAQTLYHPVGTCRMGMDNEHAVDHDFALRGANQLWVVDGSILPRLTVGNPNATIMMLAWMAAKRIGSQL